MLRLTLTALFAVAVVGTTYAAPIYKWQDADGGIHYEDTHPPQGEVQVIRPAMPYRGETQTDTPESLESANRASERREMCALSQKRLAEARSTDRIYEIDQKGNRRYLNADEIRAHVAELQAATDSWCGES